MVAISSERSWVTPARPRPRWEVDRAAHPATLGRQASVNVKWGPRHRRYDLRRFPRGLEDADAGLQRQRRHHTTDTVGKSDYGEDAGGSDRVRVRRAGRAHIFPTPLAGPGHIRKSVVPCQVSLFPSDQRHKRRGGRRRFEAK